MFEDKERKEIESIGKYPLIQKLSEKIELSHAETLCGINEDASAVTVAEGVIFNASRLFMEYVHFDLTYFPLRHLGYKCAAAAMSDLLAMNVIPTHLRINIAVSNRFSVEAMEELMTGVRMCCHRYKVDIVGLDVGSSRTGMAISVDTFGTAKDEEMVKRGGAGEKELICVSGDLGAAYAGLLILEREKQVFEVNPEMQPDLSGYDYLLERQLKPEPRLDIINALKEKAIKPTSMTNVDEGLAGALAKICNASDKGCVIYENKLPIDTLTFNTLKELKIVATTVALSGGEDYELLFTLKQEDYEKIKTIENISVIGYMQEKSAGENLITNDEMMVELKTMGR
ncbi:thiamine-phosphate kinase [Bacteroidales bacterium OttesenSCG-928-B11]|nr:thiamine-phosphate kinase [Bacteroidales bacterium OttesenSCG-928-E04]MDL2312485.1 thiamine-phosphate kinase [Bacteroidales bacterium OttesenSCG-928-B11]MDL2325716.1 thiamine-phosphate kinase [Bacteroidales bacterium OttesenSCG-928-A14]